MREQLRATVDRLRLEFQTFWTPPDTYLIDQGTTAEILIAKVRLGRLTVSAGVAVWSKDGEAPDDLIHVADARLYHAKALGRNRVVSSSDAAASV